MGAANKLKHWMFWQDLHYFLAVNDVSAGRLTQFVAVNKTAVFISDISLDAMHNASDSFLVSRAATRLREFFQRSAVRVPALTRLG